MKRLFGVMLALMLASGLAQADAGNGVISKKSDYSVTDTIDRLEGVLRKKGFTIMLRWSHGAGADRAGIPLRPTELLIFGNPKVGTHFLTSSQSAGLDLPMKMLAWQDEAGQVWLEYNDPAYIAGRHGITDRDKVVTKMSKALDNFSRMATE